uniref:MCU domain-containing protein n=1 Tax=Elaeophora elaphi TaxID=1147741 RepID=A0A0R3RY66_9BILA
MEPITYFAIFSTFIGSFSYYLFTNQSYNHNDHKRRAMSLNFYKEAAKNNFDIPKRDLMNCKNVANSLKHDLDKLRYPLYQHLPDERLASFATRKFALSNRRPEENEDQKCLRSLLTFCDVL